MTVSTTNSNKNKALTADSSTPIISVNNLSKSFSSYGKMVEAVRNVTFNVFPGELFGLFGSNGAGKTTIIKMLTTLLEPNAGSATVNGYDLLRSPMQVRASIGLVTADERSFHGRLTARENLSFYASLQNVPRKEIDNRVEEVLHMFGLEKKTNARFQSFSTGQKQRLNMARALVHDPPIIFLDEPTKSMDVQTSDFVKSLIRDDLVAKRKKTIVFISHELFEMDNFCNRVVILADGKIRAKGTPHELAEKLPRRAAFRIELEGPAQNIADAWNNIPAVETVQEVSRGVTITTFILTLTNETPELWLQLMKTVGDYAGRVERYQRVDDSSLRDVVRFFSEKEN